MAVFEWTEQTPVTANNLNVMQEQNQDEVDSKISNEISNIGKTLWEGSFSSGSINVPGLSNYSIVIVMLDSIPCFGTPSRGMGGIGAYSSYGISTYAYRFAVNGDTLSIDTYDRGGTNGTNNIPATKIIGLF